MNIKEFCAQYGDNPRNFLDVVGQWQLAEVDSLLRTLQRQHDQLIGSAVIAGDAMHGDGMLDAISNEVRDAFVNLMHEKAGTYREMRKLLLKSIKAQDGTFRSLDDNAVRGFISKLKGQIGENLFQQHVGSAAELAHSGSQEAWDVSIKQADGAYEYVQVKLLAQPGSVIREMRDVQEKVAQGLVEGCAGDTVQRIDFAIPADMVERVNLLKEQYPELQSMRVLSIPISTTGAGDYIKESMREVGPNELFQFFDELVGGTLAAGSLHAMVSGFLWYKGSKELSAAVAEAAANTTISSVGIGLGLGADALFHVAAFSGVVGVGGRLLLGRLAKSRWNFAEFLENSIADTGTQIARLNASPVGLA